MSRLAAVANGKRKRMLMRRRKSNPPLSNLDRDLDLDRAIENIIVLIKGEGDGNPLPPPLCHRPLKWIGDINNENINILQNPNKMKCQRCSTLMQKSVDSLSPHMASLVRKEVALITAISVRNPRSCLVSVWPKSYERSDAQFSMASLPRKSDSDYEFDGEVDRSRMNPRFWVTLWLSPGAKENVQFFFGGARKEYTNLDFPIQTAMPDHLNDIVQTHLARLVKGFSIHWYMPE